MQLSTDAKRIIQHKPPHWESKLLQAVLHSAADEVNRSYERATSGTNVLGFADWTRALIDSYEQLLHEATATFERELAAATRSSGSTDDPELIVEALDHFLGIMNDAIVLQQRAVFLSRHPLFGIIAEPLRQLAKPFIDGYNDLLRQLDQQLENIETTHGLRLQLTLNAPPYLGDYANVYEQYLLKFGSERSLSLQNRDAAIESFQVARGEQLLGEFRRISITDNLASGLLQMDDWYWSNESNEWKPLSSLV